MKFFLIVFLFNTQDPMMWEKNILEATDKAACEKMSSEFKVPENYTVEKYCVSQDHYLGYRQDEDVPYDFDGEEEPNDETAYNN